MVGGEWSAKGNFCSDGIVTGVGGGFERYPCDKTAKISVCALKLPDVFAQAGVWLY